jgi:hypothetical protein
MLELLPAVVAAAHGCTGAADEISGVQAPRQEDARL